MTLLQIREQFRTTSGRYDLVDAAGADGGANFYINAGCRHLDRTTQAQKSEGRLFTKVAASTYMVTFQDARSITDVWVMDQESRTQLKKLSFSDARMKFAAPYASLDTGRPLYYVPLAVRPIPEELDQDALDTLDWVTDYMDVVENDHYKLNGMLILSPPEEEMGVEILGKWYSKYLELDTDTNFWTEQHPEVVIMAAMQQVEIGYRNTQGVNDWQRSIEMIVGEVSKDLVDEESADADQMEG